MGILVILVVQCKSMSKKVKITRANMPRGTDFTEMGNLDDLMEVEPDHDGLYTSQHVKAAKPTDEQLHEKENYSMCKKVKGLAYILNNYDFPDRPRNGSKLDFINMQHLFKELGYHIVAHENLTSTKIRESIKNFVTKFNEADADYSSAVIVLMSHGDTGYIRGIPGGTDEKDVYLKEIQREFEGNKCPKLQGKPKLFFIQACRGKMITTTSSTETDVIDHDSSFTSSSPSTETTEADTIGTDDNFAKDVPDNADMHFAYATTEGFLSLRSKVDGSWFIQAITEVFLAHAHEESLDNLMNKVTNRVSGLKGKLYDPQLAKKVMAKQTPERVNRMRKTFYFLPKYPPTYIK
ncbi:caspase-3-like [Amphiura filiformis]|uniref:caspase-3-like n=1 Tax=Amphiura filiformis TaxID=82378 RepID=UPI003B20D86E